MLRDSTVAAVVRTRPRAIPLSMRTMRKSIHGFLFPIWLWGSAGRWSSAIIIRANPLICPMLFSLAHKHKENKHVCFSFAYALVRTA